MKPKTSKLLLLLLSLLLVAGCARIQERKQADQLTNTLKAYESTLRWGDLKRVYAFRTPKAEGEPQRGLDDIRVVSYVVVSPAVMLDEDNARQTAEISYYWQDQQAIPKITDEQAWGFDHEAKLWYLESDVPVFE